MVPASCYSDGGRGLGCSLLCLAVGRHTLPQGMIPPCNKKSFSRSLLQAFDGLQMDTAPPCSQDLEHWELEAKMGAWTQDPSTSTLGSSSNTGDSQGQRWAFSFSDASNVQVCSLRESHSQITSSCCSAHHISLFSILQSKRGSKPQNPKFPALW